MQILFLKILFDIAQIYFNTLKKCNLTCFVHDLFRAILFFKKIKNVILYMIQSRLYVNFDLKIH